jgi:hypothetical protein
MADSGNSSLETSGSFTCWALFSALERRISDISAFDRAQLQCTEFVPPDSVRRREQNWAPSINHYGDLVHCSHTPPSITFNIAVQTFYDPPLICGHICTYSNCKSY